MTNQSKPQIMVSHEIDFKIFGDDIQFVEIELDPGETVIAEAGAMVYMEQDITFEVKMGDGSTPNQGLMGKLLSAGSRIITGESFFLTHFTNEGQGKSRVAFAAPYPGTIIPVDLNQVRNTPDRAERRLPLCSTWNKAYCYSESKDRIRIGGRRRIYP